MKDEPEEIYKCSVCDGEMDDPYDFCEICEEQLGVFLDTADHISGEVIESDDSYKRLAEAFQNGQAIWSNNKLVAIGKFETVYRR